MAKVTQKTRLQDIDDVYEEAKMKLFGLSVLENETSDYWDVLELLKELKNIAVKAITTKPIEPHKFSYQFFEKYDDKLHVCFEFDVDDFEEWLKGGDALTVEWVYKNELYDRQMTIDEYWKMDSNDIDEEVKDFALYHLQNSKS